MLVELPLVVPEGKYCYGTDRKPCPYWRKYTNGATCELLKQVSEEGDPFNLIWDQVKECNIHVD